MPAVDVSPSTEFPRGLARETTPLGMFGGDQLVYRSIILLACLALPTIAAVNWFLRGTPSWPQLAITAGILACALVCHRLARAGLRDVAAALLIGTLWLMVTVYAFKAGYGMHSSMIFVYLPCILYTALFFGLAMAAAELVLTVAALLAMYFAESRGLISGAAAFVTEAANFNFFIGVVITCIGTLVAGAVYHRRVEREAARVVAAAEERRVALEKAQLVQAQLETAHVELQALNRELAERDAARTEEVARLKRDLDVLHAVVLQDSPAPVVMATLDALGMGRRGPLRRAPLDVSAMASEAIEQFERVKQYPGVQFDVAPGLRANGDRGQVAALLRHLLGRSARDCRGEPDPLVRVGGGSMQGEQVFYISDNGPGMDPVRRERLFQVASASGGRREDTLDIAALSARHIVEQHGGGLTVDSAPGKGTTFFFSLPTPAA